jgi:hypothetical protein
VKPPIDLPLAQLAPALSSFTHASRLHGQAHVARVMVHAFRLIDATGWTEEAPRLWAAVYLHDLARTHDGVCYRHGGDAFSKLETLPAIKKLFARGGVTKADYPAIRTAVVYHSLPKELDRAHQHWRLTSLLKDADALDRVRQGDLDPDYLRNDEAQSMVDFAQALFDATDGVVATGDDHFAVLWPEAVRIWSARQDAA